MKFDIFRESAGESYYICEYHLESSTNLREAAWALAIGQSIGNPSARSEFESQYLIDNHCCLILADEKELLEQNRGIVKIAFPEININFKTDGITQLLVQTMGGQLDIDIIKKCHLNDVILTPNMEKCLLGPKFGLSGMREYCGSHGKPLFGGITKPKVGLSPEDHLELVKKLVDGGCDFIKEDEILGDPDHCRADKRTELVMEYIRKTNSKVFYCVSIHADSPHIQNRILQLYDRHGINGVHINFHSGFGTYKSVRKMELPILIHYQKSGYMLVCNKNHDYHISQNLLFKLVSKSGCDTLHAGMIGGYLDDEEATMEAIKTLTSQNSVPALSCGMNPGLVDYVSNKVGHCNWMANVGGALSSHPMGTLAGTKAMRQAVDKNYGVEFQVAIEKWGKHE